MSIEPKLSNRRIVLTIALFAFVVFTSYYDAVKNIMPSLAQSKVEEPIDDTIVPEQIETSTFILKDILSEDFENGLSSKWYREMPNSDYSGAVSTLYSEEGTSSFRIELRKSDPNVYGSKRSEIALVEPELPLQEHTYTFSMLLPNGGEEDYGLDIYGGGEIVAKWQNVPDPGEEWTMPSLALRLQKGRYFLERNWDDAEISTDEQIISKGNHLKYDLGSYEEDKGQFVTWTFHVKWGWLKTQNPILEVYKDGVRILDLNGLPNTSNNQVGVYMKLGINKWNWAQPDDQSMIAKRVIYYDNVSIR